MFSNYLQYQLDALLKPAREALARERAVAGDWDNPHHQKYRDAYWACVIDIAAKTELRVTDIDHYLKEENRAD